MALDASFLDYCIDQLDSLDVSYRKMFGGAGIYSDEVMFGLVSGDQLYFRVTPSTEARYLEAGMGPFVPFADKPHYKMPYFEVPLSVLEQPSELEPWALEALGVAKGLKRKPKKKPKTKG